MTNDKLKSAADAFIKTMQAAGGGSISVNGKEVVRIPAGKCETCGGEDGNHRCGECGGEWQVMDEDVSKTDHECTRCIYRKYKI